MRLQVPLYFLRPPLPIRSDPYAFLGNRPASPLRPQRRHAAPTADSAHRCALGVGDRVAVELQCASGHGSDGAAPLRMRNIPGSDDSAHEETDCGNAFIALTTCRPCTTTALDGHVRHEMAGSACGRRTTQHIMHTMHHDGFGQPCSVLVSVPRQMTFPYKLATNSKARSKRNRAPSFVLLGSPNGVCFHPLITTTYL